MYLRHFAFTRLPFETPAHTDELFESSARRERAATRPATVAETLQTLLREGRVERAAGGYRIAVERAIPPAGPNGRDH